MPPTYLPRDLLKTLRGDDFSAQADQDINDFKQRLGLGGSSTNSTPAPLAPAPVVPPVTGATPVPAPVTPPPVQQPAFQLPSWNDFALGAQQVGNQIQQGAQQVQQQASQFQLPDWGNFKLGGPSNTDQIHQNAGPSGAANLPSWENFKLPGAEDPTLTGTSSPGPNATGAGGSSSSSAPVAAGGDLHAYARQAAQQAGIDPDIFTRQIQQESGFNPNAGSPAGAQGIAQIMPQYHPGVDTSDPYASLDYAANLMATHLKKYGGDYSKALSAYNAGEGATDSGAAAGFGETQTYIRNILGGGTGPTASVAAPQRPSAVDQAALDDPDKWALCGPVAAVLAATAHGADWTVAQAKGIAQKLGLWDAGNGMHGLDSEVALLKQAGVAATTGAADEQHLAADANAGNTPIVSTDGHYYILQGYDAASGKFDTGTTGTVYKGGSRWLSLAEMQGLSGTIQGAAFMDNPASPNPSVVASAEPDWRRGPNTPVASNDPLLSKGDVGNQQASLNSGPADSTYGPFDPPSYGAQSGDQTSSTSQNPPVVTSDFGRIPDAQALQGPEGNTAWSADYGPTPPEVPLSLRPQVRAIDQQPAGPIPGPADPLQGEDPNAPQGVPSYPLNDALAPGGDLAQAARPHVPAHQLIDLERQAQDAEASGDQPRADQLRAEQNDIVQNLALNMMGAPEAVGGMGRFYGRPGVPEPVPGGAPVLSAVDGLPRPSIPHSDQIAPATVQDAISRLPAEIQDAVSANVKGIKVSSAVSGQDGGGAYHPGSATAWVDPAHAADPQTIAHELLHGYVSALNDPGFIADWAAVAYDPAVALTRSAEFRSGKSINADPFANENFTRSLDTYIHNPDQLNPPVRAVFDRRFAPPDSALAAEADRLSTGRQASTTPRPGVVPQSDRYYHGTGSAFDTPNPAHFDENGLFGPGYYLTSDPRVAGSYAEGHGAWATAFTQPDITIAERQLTDAQSVLAKHEEVGPGPGNQMWWNGRRNQLQEQIAKLQTNLDDLTAQLPQHGPNVRAVDVPAGLRLLDADQPVPKDLLDAARADGLVREPSDTVRAILAQSGKEPVARESWTGEQFYKHIVQEPVPGSKISKANMEMGNRWLAEQGYDGITYAGGKRIPMKDAAGNDITHQATVIFPESLPKITNATSGRAGGLLPAEGSLVPRLAQQAVGGAVAGGYSAAQDPGADPGSVARGAALGAVGGVARGAIGRRGTGQAIARVVEHVGDAVPPSEEPKPAALPRTPPIPEGARPITLTPEQEAARLRLDKFPDWAREAVHNAAQGVDYAREQRRGVLPDATSAGMADDLGRSVERWIREGKTGRNYNAEETRALRNTVTTQASVVNDLAARVAEAQQSGGLTDALLAEAHREGQKLGALTTVAEGARAEWGRAGRAYMAATKMVDMPPTMAAERIFKKFGGGPDGRQRAVDALTEYNRLLQDGADPIQLAKYWANVEKGPPNVTDWFTALRYNSMLSGPRTFEVNAVGNGLEVPWRLGRDTLASTIRGRPGEVGPELVGTWVGMQRGAHAFMETLAHGITTEQALAGDLPNSLADRVKNPVGKATATALEMPGRLLGASDQFAKQTAYGMELGRRAAVGASKEGLSGAAWKGRVADLLATPSEEMMARSLDVARRMTYQNEMGQTGAAIQSFRRMLPGPVGNIVLPFMKTVYNISARGIDRSPLGIVGTGIDVARGKYGKDLGAALGGALPENGALVPLGERLGDNVIGGLAGLWFVGQAFQGNVTGDGPDDPGKKDILRAQGWQPYSIKVGDKWVSYSNWGPIALPLSMAAATAEGQKYAKPGDNSGQQAADTFGRFAKLATEQSYLQAIGGVYKSISDPQRYGTQWVSDFVGSLVPYGALANTVGQAGDPYVHRPDKVDVGQALENRLPGLRANVPVAQDVLGQPVKNPAQGAAAFQPFRASPQVQNPLLDAFQQAGVNIPRPGDHLSIDVKGAQGKALQVPITPDESRQWNTVRGELLQKAWDMFQAGPNWATYQQGNPEYQKTAMEAVLRAADTAAHNQMAEQIGPPEIRRRLSPAA